MPSHQPCPCGRLSAAKKPLAFAACCGRYLDAFAATPAPDAESLMRSRYSAFALGRPDYLLATWHVSQRPAELALDAGVKWLGLEVRSHTLQDASHAEVEFVARYRVGGRAPSTGSKQAVRLHELSRFICAEGRWYYVDGDQK